MLPGSSSLVMDDEFVRELATYGMTEASFKRIEALKGKPMATSVFWPTVTSIIRDDPGMHEKFDDLQKRARAGTLPGLKVVHSPTVGFSAEGYLGQMVVVIPAKKIVAVRLRRRPPNYRDDNSLDSSNEFPKFVLDLCP
jgi:CubicO group peptidase (beta-lactamase class C family)